MIELSVAAFLAGDDAALERRLAHQAVQHFRRNEATQLRAWAASLRCLRAALGGWDAAAGWRLVLEYPMRRLGRRIDAVLVTPRAVLVLEFKADATSFQPGDRRQVEDYALDLQDFHAGSRGRVIVPILVATRACPGPVAWPLAVGGATTVLDASGDSLPTLLRDLWPRLPAGDVDVAAWASAPYRPVPGIVDAARTLYARNSVADIADAGAEARNLGATTDAIRTACHAAQNGRRHVVLFVTGTPGAGKTLCGLNVVFGAARHDHATFLTGNPTLVHVLREALVRDAVAGGQDARAARQRMRAAIQALPHFRDQYVGTPGEVPSDRIAVIDEAQRSWARDQAVRASRDRPVQLSDSEPGHLLDIMARHRDWAVIVCLIGNGQEIHTGEGGLAEWGAALAARPNWAIHAAPEALRTEGDPRQRLPALPGRMVMDSILHLDIPMRSIRNPAAAAWADAVVRGDAAAARQLAASGELPFAVTRDLAVLRATLREAARGERRCGLVGSSAAKRLRADGLGVEVAHMDANAVARWFLDRWPEDVRASDALETMATEFACQGLELDIVGLCWGGDLVRVGAAWQVRDFRGTDWQVARDADRRANRINTYRVLLTRARYHTVIWVPRGDAGDRTRSPAELDAVAAFLLACGAAAIGAADNAPPGSTDRPAQALLV
ncbi:MAG: DUF2075 domain-containing protein [Acetobacteraceae bacterium]|nr:DUF2075 domain-containing protein [Acetobacteraceae bacterium]